MDTGCLVAGHLCHAPLDINVFVRREYFLSTCEMVLWQEAIFVLLIDRLYIGHKWFHERKLFISSLWRVLWQEATF